MSETPKTDTKEKPPENYRVLARKYRPTSFESLIGQEAMVRTLSNAIETGRLAHAFILTGVRGVGKTTTARIIAKALNCTGPDGTGGPTITPCGQCPQCLSITESRHVDVMEMDAASRTGIDDIREIIEGVRYAAVAARFKIYIIDEIHMLSRNAFNALLKTLEEPPEHVKFIFATTEIRKVPVTVLSRCQRFDLRRISMKQLIQHFSQIADQEHCQINDKALAMIARAAEGSVRDGLSLLDQAFAHGAGEVTEEQVRHMLGLADRAQVFDLYQTVMAGNTAQALAQIRHQYDHGADPEVVLSDMLELTHWLTRLKVVPEAGEDVVTSESERADGLAMAAALTMPVLTRAWQMLLKGLEEVSLSSSPLAAAEMLLVRMTYAAGLPTPDDMIRQLNDKTGGGNSAQKPSSEPPVSSRPSAPEGGAKAQNFQIIRHHNQARMADPVEQPRALEAETAFYPSPKDFVELVALFEQHSEATIAFHLNDNVSLQSFARGRLDICPKKPLPGTMISQMSTRLKEWTGENWIISLTRQPGDDTLQEQAEAAQQKLHAHIAQKPLVQAVLHQFPTARISDIQKMEEDFPLPDATLFAEGNFLVGEDEFGLDD